MNANENQTAQSEPLSMANALEQIKGELINLDRALDQLNAAVAARDAMIARLERDLKTAEHRAWIRIIRDKLTRHMADKDPAGR
jgi:uncharacterized protein (DUF3084 family)